VNGKRASLARFPWRHRRRSEDSFNGYLVVAIRLRRSHPQHQRRRAERAVFDYADFTGTKRTARSIRNSTIYL
ncbi:MAG: hypothetical protein DMF14_15610, partial [Verrucomicrobia bacterium]